MIALENSQLRILPWILYKVITHIVSCNRMWWWSLWCSKCIHQNSLHSSFFLPLLLSSFPSALCPPAEQRKRNTFRYTFFWQDTSQTSLLPSLASFTPSIWSSNANALHAIDEDEFLLLWNYYFPPFPTNALHSCLGGGVSALIKL